MLGIAYCVEAVGGIPCMPIIPIFAQQSSPSSASPLLNSTAGTLASGRIANTRRSKHVLCCWADNLYQHHDTGVLNGHHRRSSDRNGHHLHLQDLLHCRRGRLLLVDRAGVWGQSGRLCKLESGCWGGLLGVVAGLFLLCWGVMYVYWT